MKSDEPTFSDYVALLKRRWQIAAGVGGLIFLGSVVTVFTIPAVYEATAVIQIERPQIPEGVVGTGATRFAEELIATVTQRVLAPENVASLIERLDLYPDRRQSVPMDDLVYEFRQTATVTPSVVGAGPRDRSGRATTVTYAFTIGFRYEDPVLVSDIVNELARLHTIENTALRTSLTARTSAFLQAESEKVEKRIAEIETQIAALQSSAGGVLVAQEPMMAAQRFEQVDRELAQVEQSLRAARERKDLLETELTRTPRYGPTMSDGQPMMSGVDRLMAAQQELVALQARYSEDHPDIVRLKREIAALTGASVDQQLLAARLATAVYATEQELAAAQQTYSDDHPDVVRLKRTLQTLKQQLADAQHRAASTATTLPPADNPVYLQLLTRLRSADEEISDLTNRRAQLHGRLRQYSYNPQFEARYVPLARERQSLQDQYRDLREKYTQAALAESVETEERGQEFTVVEPARPPTLPVEPNRLVLTLLGFAVSLGAAFGSAYLADAMDATVRSSRDIEALLHTSAIAIIPFIDNPGDLMKRRKKRFVMAALALAASVLVVIILG